MCCKWDAPSGEVRGGTVRIAGSPIAINAIEHSMEDFDNVIILDEMIQFGKGDIIRWGHVPCRRLLNEDTGIKPVVGLHFKKRFDNTECFQAAGIAAVRFLIKDSDKCLALKLGLDIVQLLWVVERYSHVIGSHEPNLPEGAINLPFVQLGDQGIDKGVIGESAGGNKNKFQTTIQEDGTQIPPREELIFNNLLFGFPANRAGKASPSRRSGHHSSLRGSSSLRGKGCLGHYHGEMVRIRQQNNKKRISATGTKIQQQQRQVLFLRKCRIIVWEYEKENMAVPLANVHGSAFGQVPKIVTQQSATQSGPTLTAR
jgi:hypothetical protein